MATAETPARPRRILPRLSLKKLSIAQEEELAAYIFLLPWLLGFLLFTLGPIIASLYLSFMRWNIVRPAEFVGLYNYNRIFTADKNFRQALRVTFTYAAITMPLGIVTGLAMALLLNMKIKGMYLYRTFFYLPAVLPGVSTTLLWVWIFNKDFGLLNYLLGLVGIEGPNWFGHPSYVLPGLTIMSLWGVGGGAVIYLAGLQNIGPVLYEAAEIDGASPWQRFWRITLPLLTPTLFFQLVMGVIFSLQQFLTAFVAFSTTAGRVGGPMNAALFYMVYLYSKAFSDYRMGYGSALAWILAIMIFVLTVLVFRTQERWVYYESPEAEE
jgi:multiple sugar transport system permease protein